MTQQQEKLSAFLDGEVEQGAESSSVIDSLVADAESLEKWKRYHLMRDCLRNEQANDVHFDVSASVAKALESELSIVAPKAKWTDIPIVANIVPLVKQSGQLAVAACVTAVMIFSYQSYNQTEDTPFLSAPPVAAPQGGLAPVSLEQTRNVPRNDMATLLEQRRQLNALIEDHARQLKLKSTGTAEQATAEKNELETSENNTPK